MAADINEISNPYVGPRPFEHNEWDQARFFGRAQETQEIVSLIYGHPLVLVYAQSGAGKTSLFNARIIPMLENEGFDILPVTRVGGAMPEDSNPEEIKNLYIFNALVNIDSEASPQTLVDVSLTAFLEKRKRVIGKEGQPYPRVIIVDQFEELFTLTPDRWLEQQESFFIQVADAIDIDPLLRIVFVIREDYLAQLDPFIRLLPDRLRARYRLERLQEDAALRAIKEPLTITGQSFAPGVAESLVKELLMIKAVDLEGKMLDIKGQYVEPVQLQVVCLTLWASLPPNTIAINETHLERFGDLNRALANFYQDAIKASIHNTKIRERLVRNWCEQVLITPMKTRGTVYRGKEHTSGIPNEVIDVLESNHLIRAEYRAGARWYELTHDRFIEPILTSNEEWKKNLLDPLFAVFTWSKNSRANKAFVLEIVGGLFGILGVGHVSTGRFWLGLGLCFIWWTFVVLLTIVTFGASLIITIPLSILVSIYSGSRARNYAQENL